MLESNAWWIAGGVAIALIFGGWWLRRFGRAVQIERAREFFRLQHERYEGALLVAARATGKPRGLHWLGAAIVGEASLARNAAGAIVALVPVVVRFEPVEGSDMEQAPYAREPRVATALFTFRRGEWHTDGRIVFNLNPKQSVDHFRLEPIDS